MGKFKEGSVVVCKDSSKLGDSTQTKTGTIIQLVNGECWVLDSQGFIHMSRVNEIYAAQEE